MGQYYKPIFLTENNKPLMWVECYDFGSGAKLMEHSWMKNDFVQFVERQLMITPQKFVWAGDYADAEPECGESNLYDLAFYVGKLTHNEDVTDKYNHKFKPFLPTKPKFVVNFDKQEFVDKTKMPKDNDGWQIHPLPLLTCEGNGRGGGDYSGSNTEFIGCWARNRIGVVQNKTMIPKGFKEIFPMFIE